MKNPISLAYQKHIRRSLVNYLLLEGFTPHRIEYPGWPEVEWPADGQLDLHTQTCGQVSLWFHMAPRYDNGTIPRVGLHFGPGLEVDWDAQIPSHIQSLFDDLLSTCRHEFEKRVKPQSRD